MRIEHKGRFLFSVTSVGRRNRINSYTVDFEENKGLGACSCEHYDYRLRPIKGRCKHMRQCLRHAGKVVIRKYLAQGGQMDILYRLYAEAPNSPQTLSEYMGECLAAKHHKTKRDTLYGKASGKEAQPQDVD